VSRRQDRVLALAGVFQAAHLVREVAWQGAAEAGAVTATLASLFRFDASDTLSVYGALADIALGLKSLIAHLTGQAPPEDLPVMRYALGMLHLERRADARPRLWQDLHDGLRAAERQRDAFGLEHENTIAALAGLYQDLIGPTGPRIMVEGETTHLRDTRKAALIRALLLAGIRSAVLWRQLGASRWSLLFGRRRMIADAQSWLAAT
jgi:high frequency lysogenization protein